MGAGAGLMLTVGEISYQIYLYYQLNALEVWAKRSAFRNRTNRGIPFSAVKDEPQALAKARELVGV